MRINKEINKEYYRQYYNEHKQYYKDYWNKRKQEVGFKEHRRKINALYFQNNKEKITASYKQRRKINTISEILRRARRRAKISNLEFNITKEDIIIPKFCPIFGIEIRVNDKVSNNSISIDRIIPEKGYVKGNIQIISMLANKMKSNATKDQLLHFADWIYRTYKETI